VAVSVTVLDGPIGTMLERGGLVLRPNAWSAEAVRDAPERVAALHRAYAGAGATVHTAATFRTTPWGVGEDAERLTHAAVGLARSAVPDDHRVLGSLAPAVDCWRPDLSPPDAGARHAAQALRLARAGVDGILVETFAHPGEALAATRAAVATGLPTWTALTPGFDGTLLDPETLAAAAAACARAGAATVLVNCLPAARADAWVRALARLGLPFGVYANAGDPSHGLGVDDPGAADRYASLAEGWAAAGASVVGGCCGTGPAHVEAVARRLHASP
jgi:S-methylmethionine-dependent homocysteine/selenocysteine methylase